MTWLEDWEQHRGESAGTWAAGPRRAKLVLHTIEGRNAESALNAYKANRSWPHCTVDPVRRLRYQHLPLNVPARALRNQSGGVQTGRAPIVLQVEIVGFARESPSWALDDLDWLGSDVVGPMCRAGGVPIQCSVEFFGEDAGWTLASTQARQRLSGDAWLAYEGVLGHQHVPENTHWDPGALNIERVLSAARGKATPQPPPEEDEDMTPDQAAQLAAIDLRVTALQNELIDRVVDGKSRADRMAAIPADLRRIEKSVDERLARIEAALGLRKG